jgi:hypothetical protein
VIIALILWDGRRKAIYCSRDCEEHQEESAPLLLERARWVHRGGEAGITVTLPKNRSIENQRLPGEYDRLGDPKMRKSKFSEHQIIAKVSVPPP